MSASHQEKQTIYKRICRHPRKWFLLSPPIYFLVLVVPLFLTGCEKASEMKSSQGGQEEAAPVKVCSVISQDIPIELSAIGSVESCAVINIKAQISGDITKVWFSEGDEVKKDQVLFSIDPRPYEIALQQAISDLEKSKALLEVSKANLVRNQVQAENALNELNRNSRLLTRMLLQSKPSPQRSGVSISSGI